MALKVPANGFDPYGVRPPRPLIGEGVCMCGVGDGGRERGEQGVHEVEQMLHFVKAPTDLTYSFTKICLQEGKQHVSEE